MAQKKLVADFINNVRKDYGGLDGILYSAGVVHDNFVIRKTKEEFLKVLAPKVAGLINLDEVTRELPLGFFVLFSSIVGVLGNQGQADYATANAFMDAYAGYRNMLVRSNQRHGRTISINWPNWENGGMSVDAETKKTMLAGTGMVPMQDQAGISGFYQCLASGRDQVMVLGGDVAKIRAFVSRSTQEDALVQSPDREEDLCRNIIELIAKGELSEDQFKAMMLNVQ